MTEKKPAVYNIEAGFSFADSLAKGILERAGDDPLALSEYLILLPSRRSCRTLRDAFLRLSGGKALLLPRLSPLGDVDADDLALHMAAGNADIPDIPPAVSRLERRLLLAHAIERVGDAQSFDQAVALAEELGRFLDEVQTEGLDFSGLDRLVPEEFSVHWKKTLSFLKVLTHHWPEILTERGVIDYAARRNRLIETQIRLWEENPPAHPVIAAGSTGTVPVARRLLALVSRLPQGQLVLPGLDQSLDDESWDMIGPDHPQGNLKKLLSAVGVDRADVQPFLRSESKGVNRGRVRLMSEALRPAASTDRWRQLGSADIDRSALEGFTRVDCATPQEESDIIALILREALDTKEKTAALITPDRRLARRVVLSLQKWGIDIDDSGGQPLTESLAGSWLLLVAEAVEEKLAPVALLSLLKHPFMALGLPAGDIRRMTGLLDRLVLRGPRPSSGFDGLVGAIQKIDGEKHAASKKTLLSWLDIFSSHLGEFTALMTQKSAVPFREMLAAHLRVAEKMAAAPDVSGHERLWRAEAGEAASLFLQDLLAASADVPPLPPGDYVSLFRIFLKSVTVRSRYGAHPRLSILGQIEARLYTADLVILGGLNEGTWPELPAHDPWMSRPMRKQFGLPAPEKSISLSAHDFVQAATAPEVIITRAAKVDGTPTVPARWLLRIDAVLSAVGLDMPQKKAAEYRKWLKEKDMPDDIRPISRPAPVPPVSARPERLSVTRIETWMRDPYQIYAQNILNLRALDPVDADPGGAERGTFIHVALEKFSKAYPEALPENPVAALMDFGRAALESMKVAQEVAAFWWPRFERIAHDFIAQEAEWREEAQPLWQEISGEYAFDGFTLSGKADRIDRMRDGSYAIIDYKSGHVPRTAEVYHGLSPQLPLEALMLEKGAFPVIPAGATVSELIYWRVTGGGKEPVKRTALSSKKAGVPEMAAAAETGLKDLIARFRDPATPYLSYPYGPKLVRFSDYDHLARVKEWGLSVDDEAGEEAA